MVFHVLSIPMHPTLKEISLNAFVQKVYKFCEQMTKRGHTVYHYGHPDSSVLCSKHFDVTPLDVYKKDYGKDDWRNGFNQSVETETHKQFNINSAKLINENLHNSKDIIMAFWGHGHAECCQNLKGGIVIEASIGYDSYFTANRVFESYAQLHKVAGMDQSPRLTDIVIPPSFDSADFEFKKEKEDYLLYLGRMIDNKGVHLAQKIAQMTKTKIKFVGPQNMKNSLNKSCEYSEFINTVGPKEKSKLLSNAKALMMPTLYLEPCGWTLFEAGMSGTPVISTDFGGMSEYNLHSYTGFKCRSVNEFFWAVQNTHLINPKVCRDYISNNFNHENIMSRYENYCDMLANGFGAVQNSCKFTSISPPIVERV